MADVQEKKKRKMENKLYCRIELTKDLNSSVTDVSEKTVSNE